MKSLRLCVAVALAVMVGGTRAAAQTSTSALPRGTYSLVPDSGYAGPDVSELTITFGDDNTMVATAPDGSLIVKSKLLFDVGVMTLNDLDGANVCQYPGNYRVVGDLKTFKLALVEDGCPDRSAIITTVKWVRQR